MKDEIIYGRNSVLEALTAGKRKISRLVIADSTSGHKIEQIKKIAAKQRIALHQWNRKRIDSLCGIDQHQGVAVIVSRRKICNLQDIFHNIEQKQEIPFLLILDRIEDPRNLGALIRTAEAVGVHGVVISKHESCGVTPTVAKASAGAIEYIPIVQVSNVAMLCDQLKEKGVWLFGADPEGGIYWSDTDFTIPLAILLGSEGRGLKNILKKKCDFLISIPMKGSISSLNVATAGGVFLCEVVKQRNL